MKNFVIGIGGTGAKCLEHLLHCCSAGLGPEQLWVGMIDQDEANGNVSRTKVLLSKYQNLQDSLRNETKNDLAKDSDLLKTKISSNADSVWLPLKGADPTLEEVINYELLKLILMQTKVNIQHVKDGQLVIDTIKTEKEFDLILMDIQMPVLDGFKATQMLRLQNYKSPIFALTALNTAVEIKKYKNAGFDEIVEKPIRRELLLQLISQYFD